MNMKKQNWLWMPHPAHLIISHECRFHLSTYVGKYIISTVGEWWPDYRCRLIHAEVHDPKWLAENQHLMGNEFDTAYYKRFGYEEIGAGRKYETMVFRATKQESECCPYRINTGEEMDFKSYNDAGSARNGHMKMCRTWSKQS